MSRRTLTPTELTFAQICFDRVQPRYLTSKQQDLLRSLRSYFDWDHRLSDKQLDVLRALKHSSDLAKRRDAIARGALSQDDSARIAAKINAVYNPVSR